MRDHEGAGDAVRGDGPQVGHAVAVEVGRFQGGQRLAPWPVRGDPILGVGQSRHCLLGQISEAFFEVGGQYRRNV